MEEKYRTLEELYLEMRKIDDLSHKRYSIDFGVMNRAYTDSENEEYDRLEKEIDDKKARLTEKIKSYAKTFSSLDEFDKLREQMEVNKSLERKEKGYYDERQYGGMGAILNETQEEFEALKKLPTSDQPDVGDTEGRQL